ncbi:MAG: hypothetical protein KAS23_11880 [Anaerohalosphaera sp.]|nr:hypothetical protein [Anaerohalosphaera sp.]
MNEKEKKLEELLDRFFDEHGREKAKSDILHGDEILAGFVTPDPRQEVLEAIKLRVSQQLKIKRSARHNRMVFLRSAAAAMILIAVMLGVQFMQHDTGTKPNPIPIGSVTINMDWGDNDSGQSKKVDKLYAEVDELEASFINIRLDESGMDESSDMAQLEYEMMEIAGDFWKG